MIQAGDIVETVNVEPSVCLLAETRLVREGVIDFLAGVGAGGWTTQAASDAEELIEIAGKSCYLSFDTALNANLTRANTKPNAEFIRDSILKTRHFSVIEHGAVTLAFVNVSRVLTHELARHRHLSLSQVSGRYVRADRIKFWLPRVIRDNPKLVEIFDRAFAQMERNVKELEEASGIDDLGPGGFAAKKALTSAFRRIIGNGQANHVVVTGNHRSWREIITLRTAAGAEEEIRLVLSKVFRLLSERYPAIYADAQVSEHEGLPVVAFP
jgi:thymidylate synthase (FAD)